MSEIRILNLCHKKSILVDIYRQSLLSRKFDRRVMIVRLFNELFYSVSVYSREREYVLYIKADYGIVVFQYIVVSCGWWYMAGTTANILNVFLLKEKLYI